MASYLIKSLFVMQLDFSDTLPPSEEELYVPEEETEEVYVPEEEAENEFIPEKENTEDIYIPETEDTEEVYIPETEDTEEIYIPDKEDIYISETKARDVYVPEEHERENVYVPEKEVTQDEDDCETLHDLEEEFDSNFDECTKYEIISTDSPDIISRGRTATTRKVTARNFDFGAPLAENEPSTSFNKPNISVTRMLTFDEEDFEFTSPAVKKAAAKKSLKFTDSPAGMKHEKSDSSIGSMNSSSQTSPKSVFASESTTSMESGFVSEMEEPFLEIEDSTSPKVENFRDLLSGIINSKVASKKGFRRRPLNRSLSFNPDSKARVSLMTILENPEKRNCKRVERSETEIANKRRKSVCGSPDTNKVEKVSRPVLLRAQSENNAMIMQAMDRCEYIQYYYFPCSSLEC